MSFLLSIICALYHFDQETRFMFYALNEKNKGKENRSRPGFHDATLSRPQAIALQHYSIFLLVHSNSIYFFLSTVIALCV